MRFPNKNPKQFQLVAKEWFDDINGNSYFSARLYKNGVLLHVLPFQYGYGTQFEHVAVEALKDLYPKIPKLYSRDLFASIEKHEVKRSSECRSWGYE